MTVFPVIPIKNFLFLFLSPTCMQLKRNNGQRSSGHKLTLFFLYCHHSQRLSGISWQRTPSPGLTVKGGSNLLNTLHLEWVRAGVGEGFPSGFLCNEKLLPSTGPGLKSSLGSEAQNVYLTRKSTFTVEPTFTFQSLRSWKQSTTFILGCLAFAKTISIYSNGSILEQD